MSNYIHIPLTKEEEEDIDRMFDGSSVEEQSEDGYEEQGDFEANDLGVAGLEWVFDRYRRLLETALFQAKQRYSIIRSDWVRILVERSATQWAKDIEAITSHRFIYILASPTPPTLESFEELEYYETENMGVYLSTIRQVDGEGRNYLYIGSATSERGLKHRIMQHWNENYSRTQA
ncbi:hypothetical protein ZTR_06205 [Talaromyces verruculosus]|nr:hypothetical protein ZTR_06205 [Talaromyces verruculosus]